MEWVQLVDEQDRDMAVMEKIAAHRDGRLHRAISVFIFNSAGELLLQRRAAHKYHSAGLWTNTCCTHPRPSEDPGDAAVRRLQEEMGLYCIPDYQFKFIYKAFLENGLIEHELDYVFFGVSDVTPLPNPEEVDLWEYLSLQEIALRLQLYPERFTAWFKLIFEKVKHTRQCFL